MSNWKAEGEEDRKALKQELGAFYKALLNIENSPGESYIYEYKPSDPYVIAWPFDAWPALDEAEWFFEYDPDISTAILFGDRQFIVVQERA